MGEDRDYGCGCVILRKPHLFSSEEPWTHWGVQLKALCGREVPEAQWIAAVDHYSPEGWISAKGLCEDCKRVKPQRYEYLICEGQEAMDAEAV